MLREEEKKREKLIISPLHIDYCNFATVQWLCSLLELAGFLIVPKRHLSNSLCRWRRIMTVKYPTIRFPISDERILQILTLSLTSGNSLQFYIKSILLNGYDASNTIITLLKWTIPHRHRKKLSNMLNWMEIAPIIRAMHEAIC